MKRYHGTTTQGGNWPAATVDRVWAKARVVTGYPPNELRKDSCNAWIRRSEYGKRTDHGWEIDHIRPVSQGGGDEMSNLQPLQWRNNRHKADHWPNWSCLVSAA